MAVPPDGTHVYIVDETVSQLGEWSAKAETYADAAQGTFDSIATEANNEILAADLTAQFVPSLVSYGTLSGFSAQSAPVEPSAPTPPSDPTITSVGAVTAIDTGTAPTISVTTTDGPGGITIPPVAIPALAAMAFPTFSTNVPSIDLDQLVAEYSYEEPTYQELLKTPALGVISSVLSGSKVVSDAVWDGIYDRKKGEAARLKVENEWVAQNYAASLGMTGMSSEALTARLQRATDAYNKTMASISLESATQEALQRREDMWNGLGQALAWESMWVQHHEAIAGRALASAGKAHEALVASYNANVAYWNLLLAATEQEIQAGRLELDTVLAPLQEYRVRLEKSQQEIAVNDQTIRKWIGDWDAWKSQKGVDVSVGSQLIQLYASKWQADAARHSGDIQNENLTISQNQQSIAEFSEKWKGIGTSAQAIATQYSQRISAFSALVGQESATRSVDLQNEQFTQAKNALELDRAWKQYQTYLQEFQAKKDLSLGILQNLAAFQVGLTQGYLQAANFSMSASAPSSVSYNYSGTTTPG